jgi:hypothetical protein
MYCQRRRFFERGDLLTKTTYNKRYEEPGSSADELVGVECCGNKKADYENYSSRHGRVIVVEFELRDVVRHLVSLYPRGCPKCMIEVMFVVSEEIDDGC